MIRLEQVAFSYTKNGPLVLKNASFTAGDGKCTVLVGENGSGKSTAIGIIAGILRCTAGKAEHTGKLGYVPQESALFDDMTVLENLTFFAALSGKKLPEDKKAFPFDISEFLSKKVGNLSGGMKKRVSLACMLAGDPQTILLDEPHSALDAHYRGELSELIKKLRDEGKCILYVGHRVDEYIGFCDERYLLSDGVISPYPINPEAPDAGQNNE